jgi:uncharacterized protein YbjQ (UPF0145 family)
MQNYVFDILAIVLPVALGFFIGSYLEKSHYRSIRKREQDFINLPIIALKKPLHSQKVQYARLVTGSVVISIDYFKRFVATLRNIFGGRIKVYESLLDRARREAILRMKEDAHDADEIINIKLETSSLYKSSNNIGSLEIIAYGTAIKY